MEQKQSAMLDLSKMTNEIVEAAAQAAGDYSEDMYVATGEKDTVAEQKLADYAMA